MKKNKVLLLLAVMLFGFVVQAKPSPERKMEQVHYSNSLIQLDPQSKAPVIDGKIAPGEWDRAVILNGFSTTGTRGKIEGAKSGEVYLMRDQQYLYIAIKTVTPNDSPGGGLVCNATGHDNPAIPGDDSIELCFSSPKNQDQVKQLIFNATGDCLDLLRTISTKNQDYSWNISGMKAVSRVESFWWTLELKLPLAELEPEDSLLYFNAARLWADIGKFTTINKVVQYFDTKQMIKLKLVDKSAAVRQLKLGNPDEGTWEISVEAENRYGKEVVFAIMLHDYAYPKIDGKVTRKHTIHAMKQTLLKPGETAKLSIQQELDDTKKLVWFATAVWDASTNQFLFQRLIQGKKTISFGRRPYYAAGKIRKNDRFVAYDYPGFGHAAFEFRFHSAPPEFLQMTAPDGHSVKFPIKGTANPYYCRADIPAVPGKYAFTLSDGTNVCTILRKKFEWEGNQLGLEKVVLPPFTPIQTEGNTVSVLGRKHRLNPFGLWDSIESKGTELLYSPMYFKLTANGKETSWKNIRPLEIQGQNGHDISYTAEMENSAGLRLGIRGLAEYDGFFWNHFKLENPKKIPVSKLTLYIPLKNELMPLYHVVSNTIRTNPADRLPAGEGELWNGTKLVRQLHFGQPVMHNQLVPYVWLGGIEKGVCWFLDSSYGYKLSPKQPQVRIVRRKDQIMLEVDIINVPSNESVHEFEFGLQATPIKPIDRSLMLMTRDMRGLLSKRIPNLGDFYQVRAGFASQWAAIPLGGDYSLYPKVIQIIAKGGSASANIKNDIKAFFQKHQARLRSEIEKEYPGRTAKLISSAVNDCAVLANPNRYPSRPIMYTDPRLVYRYEEAARYYRSEWWNPARINYTAALRVTLTPSLQDYVIYCHRKLLQLGLRGINMDDAYLMPDNNPETVAKKDSGNQIHSCVGILQFRRFLKRLATMMHTEFQLYPRYLEVHATNGVIVPMFSFADGLLGMEQHYGEKPRTECFSDGEILATYTGRQIGAKPLGLTGLKRKNTPMEKWKQMFPRLTRSCIAVMIPYGITARTSVRVPYEHFDLKTYQKFYGHLADFGIMEKDCEFIPCFENKLVTTDQKMIQTAVYRRPGKVLACLSNFDKKPLQVNVKTDSAKLGLKPDFRLIDWEKRQPMESSFTLEPGDFKLICFENGK